MKLTTVVLVIVASLFALPSLAQPLIPPVMEPEDRQVQYEWTLGYCDTQYTTYTSEWHACVASDLWWISDIVWGNYLLYQSYYVECAMHYGDGEICGVFMTGAMENYQSAHWFADVAQIHWDLSQ